MTKGSELISFGKTGQKFLDLNVDCFELPVSPLYLQFDSNLIGFIFLSPLTTFSSFCGSDSAKLKCSLLPKEFDTSWSTLVACCLSFLAWQLHAYEIF
jgi:hypothetical protein